MALLGPQQAGKRGTGQHGSSPPDDDMELSLEPLVPVAVNDGVEQGGAEADEVADEEDDQDGLGVVAKQLVVDVHHEAEAIQWEPADAEAERLEQQLLAGHTSLPIGVH